MRIYGVYYTVYTIIVAGKSPYTIHTVIYGVHIRFWPTLQMNDKWYGMVWYGMVWYGMVWYGVV